MSAEGRPSIVKNNTELDLPQFDEQSTTPQPERVDETDFNLVKQNLDNTTSNDSENKLESTIVSENNENVIENQINSTNGMNEANTNAGTTGDNVVEGGVTEFSNVDSQQSNKTDDIAKKDDEEVTKESQEASDVKNVSDVEKKSSADAAINPEKSSLADSQIEQKMTPEAEKSLGETQQRQSTAQAPNKGMTTSKERAETTMKDTPQDDNHSSTDSGGGGFVSLADKFQVKRIDPDGVYFTPSEVALHNAPDDLWMSYKGYVYNLTPLAKQYKEDPLLVTLLRNAGGDISHWFDPVTRDLKTHVNPLTGCKCPYTPDGRFLHVPPPLPRSDWNPCELEQVPWWMDEKYCVGKLSSKTRKIRVVNTLTKHEHTLEVCSEERISAIQDRYLAFNAHAKGYMWKRLGVLLDMNMTLEANGIPDQSRLFEETGIDEDQWLPCLHLYFSDDLTVA